MQYNSHVLPIEVKSGINVKAKSLKLFRETYLPKISIRFSLKNNEYNSGLLSIILYNSFLFEDLLNDSLQKCVQ